MQLLSSKVVVLVTVAAATLRVSSLIRALRARYAREKSLPAIFSRLPARMTGWGVFFFCDENDGREGDGNSHLSAKNTVCLSRHVSRQNVAMGRPERRRCAYRDMYHDIVSRYPEIIEPAARIYRIAENNQAMRGQAVGSASKMMAQVSGITFS